MKSAKLGALFLIAVMALAGVGAGYAMWFQELTIDVEINTGDFKVGVRDDGTGDPGPHYPVGALYPQAGQDPAIYGTVDMNHEPGDNYEGKNVANTTSINGAWKFNKTIDGQVVPFYHNIYEFVYNAYPWYESWIMITFANGGTIPAKIADGHWNPMSDPMGLFPFLAVGDVYIYVDGTEHGPYTADFLEGFQYQLDPCHTVSFKIHFYFIEFIDENQNGVEDEGEPVMPQGATMSFQYYIKWAQWNEVSGTPTPLT